jgi:uncharacterized protein (PEP-CTERM system associated)
MNAGLPIPFERSRCARAVRVLLGCTALTLAFGGQAQQQENMNEGFIPLEPVEGPPPPVWFEPRMTLGMSVRNTGSRSSPRRRIEERMEFSPGISGVVNTPRIQGSMDYEFNSYVYPQNEKKSRLSHQLEAEGTVNAWANRAFVDVGASVRQRAISLFDDPGYRRSSEQTAESTLLQVSPFLVGSVGRLADYQLRYSAVGQNMGSDELPGLNAQTASAHLASRRGGGPLGWLVQASTQTVDYEYGRDTRSDSARAGVVLRPTDTLSITATGGRETNDILTLEPTEYDTRSLQLAWRPSKRTRVAAGAEDRYFGRGHNLLLQHTTARTVWRYTDTRGVSTAGDRAAAPMRLGDYFSKRLRSLDPTITDEALFEEVGKVLAKGDLPPDRLEFPSLLSSTATLQRSQRLSVALVGVRNTATLAYVRDDIRRLPAPLADIAALVDDFRTNTTIEQKGWNLSLSHRLTPLTTAIAGVTQRSSVGDVDSRYTKALDLGVVSRLTRRTEGSVNVNFSRHSGNFRSYNDAGMSALIVHRF